ncbi:MAG: putative LPS assembly protein LptD [Flavobacteriaceae bacterium]
MQTYTKYILLFTFLLGVNGAFAQDIPVTRTIHPAKKSISLENNNSNSQIKKLSNSIKPIEKPKADLKDVKIDSVKTDTILIKNERLEDIIKDKAKIRRTNIKKKITTLYDEAELYYQDIEIKAGEIIIDHNKNLAYIKGIVDSTKTYTQKPHFKQGNQETTQDSLIYSFKTKKAVVYGVKTEHDGLIINALTTVRANDSTMYMDKVEITTSKKVKRDYYIVSNKIKMIQDKKAIGGKSQLFLGDVPTPVILPFFYIPLTKGRASGILLPTYGDNNNGYFLQNGGFYFAISDYTDLAVTGDIYTNGSWGLRFDSNYKFRYKFGGRFGLRIENLINGQRGLTGYSKTNSFHVNWSHNQDAKSNPNSRFSASVNFGSSKFFRQSLNELSRPNFLNNTLSSSISYFRNFEGTPFNLNAAITHSQNTNTEVINMSLPNISLNMDRQFPFAPKDGPKKTAIQKIGLSYSMVMQNQIATSDDEFFKPGMFDKAKTGMKHSVSLSTNFKALKYITVSPSINYKDVWYLKTIGKKWDPTTNNVVTDTINGFKTFRDYSGSVSASTTIYGMFNFKKGKMNAIRHTIRPSVSYGYTPDFSYYYDEVQNDILGNKVSYSRFDGAAYGAPNRNMSQSLSMNLRNVFEAKVIDKDSIKSKSAYKKLKLLNNLDFSTSYNMEADTLKWTPVRMSASTILFKQMNVNFNATLDPYAITAGGRRINTFNVNNNGSLFRLTNANVTASYRLSNETFRKKKDTKDSSNNSNKEDGQFGGDIRGQSKAKNDKDPVTKKVTLYNLDIPWSLSLNYNLGYTNRNREKDFARNTVRFNGNVELTPKWSVNFSSGYDIKDRGLSYTTIGFARDLDSWHMTFNWTPLGNRSTYYFFIGVKASALSDLKYDQHKVPDKRLF